MPYIKCTYYPGIFSDEYFIEFENHFLEAGIFGGVFVNREDVIPKKMNLLSEQEKDEGREGYLRVKFFQIKKGIASLAINDVGNHRLSRIDVPENELLDLEDIIEGA